MGLLATGIMNRPTTEFTHDAFMLKTSWVSEGALEPVAIEAKGYHYPYSNKACLELRHLLDIFYNNSRVKYTVKDFIKINKEKLSDMFELCGESWETSVFQSLKAWLSSRARDETWPAIPHVRQEWTITILGTMGMLLQMGHARRERYERDRAQAMLAGILSELAFIEYCDFEWFMGYLDRARCQCPDSHGGNFCYHVHNDLGDWMASSRIMRSRQKMFLGMPSFSKNKLLQILLNEHCRQKCSSN